MKKIKAKKGKKVVKDDFSGMDLKNIPLGFRLKDRVTGFVGIATGKVIFLNGCVQYIVKPQGLGKDLKVQAAETFDCQQIEIIDSGIAPKLMETGPKPPGGDMPDTNVVLRNF